MENDNRVSLAELAYLFDVSLGNIFTILTDHLEIKRFAARWILRLLFVLWFTSRNNIHQFLAWKSPPPHINAKIPLDAKRKKRPGKGIVDFLLNNTPAHRTYSTVLELGLLSDGL